MNVFDKVNDVTRDVQKYWIPEFEILIEKSTNEQFLSPDMMITLKASHANWDIHWGKTMKDILFLKSKGHEINRELYDTLVVGWTSVHGWQSAPLVGKTKEQFFDDSVKRLYDHDSIHEAVAFYERPIFERTLSEQGEVRCLESKFLELKHEDKIKMAKEEIYVTALERYLIPNNLDYSLGRAYNSSLKKFITTMSSGWMSFFLIDNFKDLIYDKFDYSQTFKNNRHKLTKL